MHLGRFGRILMLLDMLESYFIKSCASIEILKILQIPCGLKTVEGGRGEGGKEREGGREREMLAI